MRKQGIFLHSPPADRPTTEQKSLPSNLLPETVSSLLPNSLLSADVPFPPKVAPFLEKNIEIEGVRPFSLSNKSQPLRAGRKDFAPLFSSHAKGGESTYLVR